MAVTPKEVNDIAKHILQTQGHAHAQQPDRGMKRRFLVEAGIKEAIRLQKIEDTDHERVCTSELLRLILDRYTEAKSFSIQMARKATREFWLKTGNSRNVKLSDLLSCG
ncbi:MAG: hypothetical protein ABJ360_21910, partial [Roseobacter sp.]